MVLPHGGLHIAPGGEDPLAPDAVHLIHDAVENPHADIGHADFIGVREAEGHAQVHLGLVLDDLSVFAAHVPRRLLDRGQNAMQLIHHKFHSFVAFGFILPVRSRKSNFKLSPTPHSRPGTAAPAPQK